MNAYKYLEKVASLFKKLFLQGLFTLLPITATIFFVNFTYKLITGWLTPLKLVGPQFLQQIPGAEILLFILFVILAGIILQFFIFAPIVHKAEKFIDKIPLIRTIYSSSKTVVDFFNVPNPAKTLKKVVIVEYPRKNVYSIGFLLESSKKDFQKLLPQEQEETAKVFIPSSPAPTTGYFLLIRRSEIINTDITFEEAIKAVVSCGLITPESLKNLPD